MLGRFLLISVRQATTVRLVAACFLEASVHLVALIFLYQRSLDDVRFFSSRLLVFGLKRNPSVTGVEIILRMAWWKVTVLSVVRRLLGVTSHVIVHHWWKLARYHSSWALSSVRRGSTLTWRHVNLMRSRSTRHRTNMRWCLAISRELSRRASILSKTHVAWGHTHSPLVLSVYWRHPVHSILMRWRVSTIHRRLLMNRGTSEATGWVWHAGLSIVWYSHWACWDRVSIVVERGRRRHSSAHYLTASILTTIIAALRSWLNSTLGIVGLLRLTKLSCWGRLVAIFSRLTLLSGVAKSYLARQYESPLHCVDTLLCRFSASEFYEAKAF